VPGLLRAGDLLVVNDTKVIPAQLTAMRGQARVGVTLDRRLDSGDWRVLLRNARRVRVGDVLEIDPEFSARVVEVLEGGAAVLRFAADDFYAALARSGALALPPYIARPDGVTAQDEADYQTMFAQHEGAVAAPTAGLHFTPELLAGLAAAGVEMVRVTLHVGAGTFLPVRVENLDEHRMHAERGFVSAEAAARMNAVRAAGGRIIPVGTTALRVVESAADEAGVVRPFDGETDIFILPGYKFRVADLLFTNFHLPHSTLLMLVSAFAGVARIKAAYAHAIAAGYRFYSYGDACLLERA
jgi:S-adenosylmethionine:tRNA ribosyltransferase-isomerase